MEYGRWRGRVEESDSGGKATASHSTPKRPPRKAALTKQEKSTGLKTGHYE
jgi:hypothetical protein